MFKRCLIICVALSVVCLVAFPVHAQVFSLWGDEAMTTIDVFVTGPFQQFSIYVFLHPDEDGAFAAEYKLSVPAGHFAITIIPNPVVSTQLGNWFGFPGISAAFIRCQTELFWIVNLTMMSADTVPGFYVLELHDDSQFLGVAICPYPRPLLDGYIYNYFCFNTSCWPATEESSWGAVKSMYR